MSARKYGKLHIAIHRNAGWRQLEPDPQWLYMTLLSQPNVDSCGVIPVQIEKWASCAKGMTASRVRAALQVLMDEMFVVVDHETHECLIRSYLEHDVLAAGSPKVFIGALRSALNIQSDRLRGVLAWEAFRKGSERLSDGFGAEQALGLLNDLVESLPEGFTKPFESLPESLSKGLFVFGFEKPPTQVTNPPKEPPVVTNRGTSPDDDRPSDRMGRPTMSLTTMAGNAEPPPPSPPPVDRQIPTEANEIIRASLPDAVCRNRKLFWGCQTQVGPMITSGVPRDEIEETLREWFANDEDCKPGNIPYHHGKVIQRRTQPPPASRRDQKIMRNLAKKNNGSSNPLITAALNPKEITSGRG